MEVMPFKTNISTHNTQHTTHNTQHTTNNKQQTTKTNTHTKKNKMTDMATEDEMVEKLGFTQEQIAVLREFDRFLSFHEGSVRKKVSPAADSIVYASSAPSRSPIYFGGTFPSNFEPPQATSFDYESATRTIPKNSLYSASNSSVVTVTPGTLNYIRQYEYQSENGNEGEYTGAMDNEGHVLDFDDNDLTSGVPYSSIIYNVDDDDEIEEDEFPDPLSPISKHENQKDSADGNQLQCLTFLFFLFFLFLKIKLKTKQTKLKGR